MLQHASMPGQASSTTQSQVHGGRSQTAGGNNTGAFARQSYSNMDMDIRVKGKSSIRTLIRLANTRAVNEDEEV